MAFFQFGFENLAQNLRNANLKNQIKLTAKPQREDYNGNAATNGKRQPNNKSITGKEKWINFLPAH